MLQAKPTRKTIAGVTLAEVVFVMALLAVLAAIMAPAFTRAKAASSSARCIANLRYIYAGLSIYRNEYEGTDDPAPSLQMGLPQRAYEAVEGEAAGREASLRDNWVCHGQAPFSRMPVNYTQMWPAPSYTPEYNEGDDARWIEHVRKMGQAAILMEDWNHQLHTPINRFTVQKSIGLHLGGFVKFKIRRGDSSDYRWWEE